MLWEVKNANGSYQTRTKIIPCVFCASGMGLTTCLLVWLDDGETIRVVPIPADPLAVLRGRGRGQGMTEKLLAERQQDRANES